MIEDKFVKIVGQDLGVVKRYGAEMLCVNCNRDILRDNIPNSAFKQIHIQSTLKGGGRGLENTRQRHREAGTISRDTTEGNTEAMEMVQE